ncbi:MAG: peptide chain release factor N(5)-glutamine methyltransferase [Actinomycetota bacterium]
MIAAGIPNALREARWLAESAGEEGALRTLAARRASGEPLQYLTGTAGFRYLELAVGPGVFIPRPETELVVECAMAHLPEGGIVFDIGTGSGAIALSIAHERPDTSIFATELDPDALKWAERNRDALGKDATILRGDLFEGLPEDLRGRVDVIVSNPPYVAPDEREALPIDVRDHEPEVALFAGGNGLDVIARLVHEARSWLRTGGWLVFEIGERQADAATALLIEAGYVQVATHDDLAGKARYVEACSDG